MSRGSGNLQSFQHAKAAPAPPPATVTAANNGTSLSGTTVQLGQAVGAVGNPGRLLNAREIPLNSFSINMPGTTIDLLIDDTNSMLRLTDPTANRFLLADLALNSFGFGDMDSVANGVALILNNNFLNDIEGRANVNGVPGSLVFRVNGGIMEMGDLFGSRNKTLLSIDDASQLAVIRSNPTDDRYLSLDVLNSQFRFGDIDNTTAIGGLIYIDGVTGLGEFSAGGVGADKGSMFVSAGGGYASGEFSGVDGLGSNYDLFIDTSGEAYISLNSAKVLQLKRSAGFFKMGEFADTFLTIDNNVGEFILKNAANTSKVRINGSLGFTGTVTPVNSITVVGGIVTAVS